MEGKLERVKLLIVYILLVKKMRFSGNAARMAKNSCNTATKDSNVDTATNLNEVLIKVADAVFESTLLCKSRSVSVRSAVAPDFLRTRSSQATGDVIAVADGASVVKKPSEPMADVVNRNACPKRREVPRGGS